MTNIFKPGARTGGESDDSGDREPDLPPGDYVVALVWFKRQTSARTKATYLRTRFEVCAGPSAGLGFWTAVSLDTSKLGSRKRLELWMEAVGCEEGVDLDSDRDIAATFKNKAFKATVSRKENAMDDGRVFVNYDLDRIIYPRLYSDSDRDAIEKWNEREWKTKDPVDSAARGDRAARGPKQRAQEEIGGHEEPAWSSSSSFADDDIPF
jgi:hypothetical protein